jgi:hypothetical protein
MLELAFARIVVKVTDASAEGLLLAQFRDGKMPFSAIR